MSRSFKDPSIVPLEVQSALKSAIKLEGAPESWYRDLLWIIAQESEGKVGVKNQQGSSARGLFQLTKINYSLNPHGEDSFGKAVEECQGGIKYIKQRYKTPARAVEFWKKHF